MPQDLLPGFLHGSELPMSTLTSGCAPTLLQKQSILARILLSLVDRLFCAYLKIAATGIQKVILRRRGLSLIRDIGLKRSYLVLVKMNSPIKMLGIPRSRSWLDSGIPPMS